MSIITLSLRSRHLLKALVTVSAALLAASAVPAMADPFCPTTPPVSLHLPHFRAALDRGVEGLIVALGSSSTEGVMASDSAHSYPATLQAVLSRALPGSHIAVINRGIGGQDAPEELARLESDVIAMRPQLVIWQVGANGAMRNADPKEFERVVSEGVQRLQAKDIDVVLMDNQHCPRVDATREGIVLDGVLGRVAESTGAGLFSRAALMEAWAREGAPMAQFISSDGLHHNDRGYACIARALARDIQAAVAPSKELSASR